MFINKMSCCVSAYLFTLYLTCLLISLGESIKLNSSSNIRVTKKTIMQSKNLTYTSNKLESVSVTGRSKRQLNPCYSNPCSNGGLCYDLVHLGGFFCKCMEGYTGAQCEKEINECESNPCQNGAQCLDLVNSFFCVCPNGFTGVVCDASARQSVCPPNACGDGECVLTTHPTFQYACKCKDGSYKFEPCSSSGNTTKCSTQPCGTNLCIDAPNSPTGYVCQCSANDYRPSNCQTTSSTACQTNSCSNGGTCVTYNSSEPWCNPSQVGKSCCQCVTGYTGNTCETEINECASNPCQNGGICDNLVNSYKCNCQLGFTGTNCEQALGCRDNPCKFGGTCVLASDGSETCRCKDGFTGTFCENDINECLSSPCSNGGTCIDLENSYACYCPDGYFRPTFCPSPSTTTTPTTTSTTTTTTTSTTSTTTSTTPALTLAISQTVTLCEQNICFNRGTCYIFGGVSFVCICPAGFTGDMCQISLPTTTALSATASCTISPNSCFNGGICTPRGCICASGYSGTSCEKLTTNNSCSQTLCGKNGVCRESTPGITTYAYCDCNPGYTGTYCETEYFKCSQNGIFVDPYGCETGRYLECVHYGQDKIGYPNGVLYRRDCPAGLRYNPKFGYCDYAANVSCR